MRSSIVLVVLAALAGPAAAEPELDEFLEQRVPEELAAHGTVLSRTGVKLEIEVVRGEKLLISLVDSSGHTVASTKLDEIPDDREEAVEKVVKATKKLVDQLGESAPAATKEAPPAGDAEYKFRQEAIYFGSEIAMFSNGHGGFFPGTVTVPFQGEIRRPLDIPTYFDAVGRHDLAESFSHRRNTKIGFLVGGSVLELAGLTLVLWKGLQFYDRSLCLGVPDLAQCQADEDAKQKAFDDAKRPYIYGGIALAGAGLITMLIPLFYSTNPVSEAEFFNLAAEHNARLRKKYGLTSSRRVRFAPLALVDGGGMMVHGQF